MNKIVYIYGIISLLLIFGIFLDSSIALFFSQVSGFEILMSIFHYLGKWYSLFVISIIIVFYYNKKKILPLIATLGVSSIFVYVLKEIIMRPRPFEALGITPFVYSASSSFPSGHVTLVTSLLPLFYKLNKKLFYFWIGFSFLVLLSRLYLSLHYLSDVLSSILFGISIGIIVLKFSNKKK